MRLVRTLRTLRSLRSRTVVGLLGVLAVVLTVPTPATGDGGRPPGGPGSPSADTPPVMVFVTDGMRQDLTRQYVREGRMPAFADVLRGASTREGLVPPPIANSAPGWTTLLTGASVADSGIVNNTYFDATRPFGSAALSGFDAAQVEAENIFVSAQRQGLDVMSLGVVGFTETWIEADGRDNVAVEYFPDWLGARGIVANYDVPLQNTDLISLNDFLTSTSIEFTPADGWSRPPRSHSPQMEATFETTGITFHLLASDTTDNRVTDYDDVLVALAEDAHRPLTRLGAGEWSPSLDVTTPDGLAGGIYLKVLDLAPDLSRFRMYHTPVTRIRAHPATLEDELVARFDAVPPQDDYSAYLLGLIDADTYVEQTVMATEMLTQRVYPWLLANGDPDLVYVGNQVVDSISHRFTALADPANPRYSSTSAGYMATAYRTADAGLAAVREALPGANVVVTSDHGFSAGGMAINANHVLAQAGLYDPANPAGSQAIAYAAGAAANVYINLIGRSPTGVVDPEDHETVQARIESAFQALGPDVIEHTFRWSETAAIPAARGTTLDLQHPTRTGDVVVFAAPPHQFDAPRAGRAVAATPIEGQHGHLPDATPSRYAVFAATGPSVIPRQVTRPIQSTDVVPTVAALLSVGRRTAITAPADSAGSVVPIVCHAAPPGRGNSSHRCDRGPGRN